jgi:hypothetical protein
MKSLFLPTGLLLLLSAATADAQQLSALPQASLPLSPNDQVYVTQGNISKSAPVSALGGLTVLGPGVATALGNAVNAAGGMLTYAIFGTANVWTAPQSVTPTTLTISASTFIPNNTSNNYVVILVHAACPCTLANPSTMTPGTTSNIEIVQSATGSDTIGTWGTFYKFPGGTKPTLSTAPNAVDALSCNIVDSTHALCNEGGNYQ